MLKAQTTAIAITLLSLSTSAAAQHGADHHAQRAAAHAANPSRSHAVPTHHHPQALAADVAAIEKWLDGYDAAFIAKDLDKLATYYHPDVTIYEGGGIDNGWVDYRDTHLGPELKSFENLQFGHTDRKIHVLGDGRSAYVTSNYFIKAKMGERTLDSSGLETLVLIKAADGTWKIRHTHTSARARRPAGGGAM
jgi:ketosteroid isomerase-like protein